MVSVVCGVGLCFGIGRGVGFGIGRGVGYGVGNGVGFGLDVGAGVGFGAELGISTQKLHARGPMGLPEICTYKYLVEGDGQIRV